MTEHGYVAYTKGCRCAVCREAARVYRRANRAGRLTAGTLNHGTRTAYDCGCRCERCLDARKAIYQREKAGAR